MLRPRYVLVLFFLLIAAVTTAYAYEAFQGPTELIQYKPAKAYNGYTLFSPFRGSNTYLIDMYGNVVHMWSYPEGWSAPGAESVEKHARLLEDGSLLRGAINHAAGEKGATYTLYDWDGNILWQYKDPRADHTAHHDFRMIWNPKLKARTLMYVSSRDLSHEEAVALGCDPNLRGNYSSAPDGIVEVDMDGNVIWEWNISDHLIQDVNPDAANYVEKGKTIADYPGKLDPNFGGGRTGDWIHANSFDYNEVLDQVVINNSTDSEFYVVDFHQPEPQSISKQIVWAFESNLPNAFYGHYISGCQRLPNGNTLIDSGPHGHFFEVTKEGEIVWEYINPVGDQTRGDYGIYKVMTDAAGAGFNSVFRCHRYSPDYPGLSGRDLTPKGKITEIHANESDRPSYVEH